MNVFLAINLVIAALCAFEVLRALRSREVSVPMAKVRLARGNRPGAYWITVGFWSALLAASVTIAGQEL